MLGLALCLGTAGLASAANVRGKLLLGAYKPEAPASPSYWEVENGFKEIAKPRLDARRELAAILVGDSPSREPQPIELSFHGGSLLPETLVVRPGTTLQIRNDDEIAHELYAKGLDGFSAEATSPGAVRSVRVTKAGHWPLRDRLVTHVHGHLHVRDDLVAVGSIQRNGDFAFSNVPPGTYELKVLHGPHEIASQTVEVSDRADLTVEAITPTAPSP